MKILVTGSAGFIGFHLAKRLAAEGHEVVGLDNLNNYYDVKLKLDRLQDAGIESQKIAYNEPVISKRYPNYTFVQLGVEDAANVERLFSKHQFKLVCHLAAQAGVRYSIKHPEAYIQSNIVGFFNIMESCRHHKIEHFVYASSSSVYGDAQEVPFKVSDRTDAPISFYAATKKSNELMAHTYSHLYNLPCTGLRFFTVYGPWGRPDMAYSLFTKAILEGQPIKVFNEGRLSRDFTYVDDIVEGIVRILEKEPTPAGEGSGFSTAAPYKLYNIGNSEPTPLMEFINAIEDALGIQAKKEMMTMQPGDVETTYADVSDLINDFGYHPKTKVREGIDRFVKWYLVYNQAGSKAFI
jgi:UDP-glucuronate 4-epimerase